MTPAYYLFSAAVCAHSGAARDVLPGSPCLDELTARAPCGPRRGAHRFRNARAAPITGARFTAMRVLRPGAGRAPRGPRRDAHRVHHARDDDGLAQQVAVADHALLHQRHLLRQHVQAQVAARQDDAVGRAGDALEVEQRLPRLALGDHLRAR